MYYQERNGRGFLANTQKILAVKRIELKNRTGMPKGLRRRIKIALKILRQPWLTGPRIRKDLHAMGVRAGDILLVHSSLSSLGFVIGGASTVIRALLDVLGPDGTLVLPTHSWESMELGNRLFDVQKTPSCVGTISEEFRKMSGVRRSLHPTHSLAAIGPWAEELIRDHECCLTPCGADSPYGKLLLAGGRVLFIGVGLESNTSYHTIEAMAAASYLLMDEPDVFTIVDEQGQDRQRIIWRHRAKIPRRFAELEGELISNHVVLSGLIGKTRCLLLDGTRFINLMSSLLERYPSHLLGAFRNKALP